MAAFPGLPKIPFLMLGAGVGAVGWRLRQKAVVAEKAPAAAAPARENLETLLKVEPLAIEVGLGLVKLVEGAQNSPLLRRIASIRRQLASELAVHVDGVYSRIAGDRKTVNVNLPDAATGQRPYQQFGRIDVDQSISKSTYRALYVRLDKRSSRNYQYLLSYSVAKGSDNNPAGRFVDQANTGLDWGPANFERRHSLVASGAVQVPFDIQLGAVFTLRSSLPFSATAGRDLNGDTFVSDYVPGTSRNQGNRDLDLALVNAWRAPAGFAPIASVDSTRFRSVDLRASKSIRFAGERRAEIVMQVFNVFNTVNLSGLGTNALAATFGVASRASAGRQAEAAVRCVW